MKKVLFMTDYPASGSGYATISTFICNGLVELGYNVKMLGLSNRGEEHHENFSIIPIDTMQEAHAAVHNLLVLWKPDVVIVALDIPQHDPLIGKVKSMGAKYIVITPMENGPLTPSWASLLSQADDVFFISKLGEDEAKKAGLETAKHLHVTLSNTVWYPATAEERSAIRNNLGFAEDEKIILTVADNQERKNLWGGLEIIRKLKLSHPDIKIKYVLVTREHSPYGYKLMELAYSMGLHNEIVIFERGMPVEQLRFLYISADAFLLPSKAEGLGLPVMEALMCGCKCVATDTGALSGLLAGKGWLVPSEYTFIDVWGNSKRDMINTSIGAEMLWDCLNTEKNILTIFPHPSLMVDQIHNSIVEICGK